MDSALEEFDCICCTLDLKLTEFNSQSLVFLISNSLGTRKQEKNSSFIIYIISTNRCLV